MNFFEAQGRTMMRAAVLAAVGLAAVSSDAVARIGDTPEQMAARIIQPDLGKNFSWPRDMPEQARERARRENPLCGFQHLLPEESDGWREQIYWKSSLRKQLSNEDGWRVHAYFLKGRSVVELYRRVGQGLNEFEVNAILARMRGTQTWRKVDPKALKPEDSVLGFEYELGEGDEATLRARKQGDWLVIFHRRFDELLLERRVRWQETEAVRQAERRASQAETAPVSVEGF